jgi:hypothetical protein
MFQRILTEKERHHAKAYLKTDGEKGSIVRSLASRAKKHLPTIEADLALLKQLLQTYERKRHSQ